MSIKKTLSKLMEEADAEFQEDMKRRYISKLKAIKESVYETKRLYVKLGKEQKKITESIEEDLKILESM